MKDNNRRIVIKDKGCTYIFQVNVLLKPSDMETLRGQIRKQIEEGCVLLPPCVEWVNE